MRNPIINTKIEKLISALVLSLGIFVSAAAIAAYISGVWLCDIASQFRLVFAIIQLTCIITLLCVRARIATAILLVTLESLPPSVSESS